MSDDRMAAPRHEAGDIGLRFALLAVTVLTAVLLGVVVGTAWMFPSTIGMRFVPAQLPQPASPALQSSPRADMAAFLRAERQQLDTAGWLDRQTGRVHLPIESAMRKIAAEGIPDWPAGRP